MNNLTKVQICISQFLQYYYRYNIAALATHNTHEFDKSKLLHIDDNLIPSLDKGWYFWRRHIYHLW